jgi:hypothetical protein
MHVHFGAMPRARSSGSGARFNINGDLELCGAQRCAPGMQYVVRSNSGFAAISTNS